MLFTKRNCYTYLIGWSSHNKFYYGKQTRIGCDPSKFWVSYFTSSTHVKSFRKRFGDPDIIQIRKVFGEDHIKCSRWETKVLTRLNCAKDPRFINKTNNTPAFTHGTTGVAPAFNKTGEYIGLVDINDKDWKINIFGINHFDPELDSKMKERNDTQISDGTHPFLGENNPSRRKVKAGTHHWLKANRHPTCDETQRNLVKIGAHHWLSDTHKQEVSQRTNQSIKNGTHPFGETISCPHCGKKGQRASLLRWHFEKCRSLRSPHSG